MSARTQITVDPDLQRRARGRPEDGRSALDPRDPARRSHARVLTDVQEQPTADISIFFDLVKDGPATDIAHDKDKMLSGAVWDNYLRKVGRQPRRSKRQKPAAA